MAITPYVRIPYASERDRYTGRDYTAQQLALMEQQSARESAYAHDRAQRMADRWSGFGGLLTETLGDLRQSREVREAQALEQERYDAEQARLAAQDKRSIDLYDRTVLRDEVERALPFIVPGGDIPEGLVDQFREFSPAMVEDYERPASEQATLASLAPPAAKMGDRAFANAMPVEGLLGGGFGTAPDERRPVRFGETFAPVQDIGAGIPAPHIGPSLVAGKETVPATSGTRLRMTAAQVEALEAEVETDAQYRQQRERSIAALQAGVEAGVLDPTQATAARAQIGRDGTLPPSAMTLLMKGADEPTYPSTAFASIRDALVQEYTDRHGTAPTGAALQTISLRAMSESRVAPAEPPTFTPGFPRGMANYLAKLQGRRTWAQGNAPGGAQTGPPMTREQVIEEVFGRAWPELLREHENIDAREVWRAIDIMWPRLTASGNRPEWYEDDPGRAVVFGSGGDDAVVPWEPAPTELTREQLDELVQRIMAD